MLAIFTVLISPAVSASSTQAVVKLDAKRFDISAPVTAKVTSGDIESARLSMGSHTIECELAESIITCDPGTNTNEGWWTLRAQDSAGESLSVQVLRSDHDYDPSVDPVSQFVTTGEQIRIDLKDWLHPDRTVTAVVYTDGVAAAGVEVTGLYEGDGRFEFESDPDAEHEYVIVIDDGLFQKTAKANSVAWSPNEASVYVSSVTVEQSKEITARLSGFSNRLELSPRVTVSRNGSAAVTETVSISSDGTGELSFTLDVPGTHVLSVAIPAFGGTIIDEITLTVTEKESTGSTDPETPDPGNPDLPVPVPTPFPTDIPVPTVTSDPREFVPMQTTPVVSGDLDIHVTRDNDQITSPDEDLIALPDSDVLMDPETVRGSGESSKGASLRSGFGTVLWGVGILAGVTLAGGAAFWLARRYGEGGEV